MEAIKKILRTPSAFVLFLAAIVSLIGVIIKSETDKAIARIPIDATLTAEGRLTEIANFSNITQLAISPSVPWTPSPTNTEIQTSTLIAAPRVAFGPADGELLLTENIIPFYRAKLWLRNFAAQATFSNPYDVSEKLWSYGFGFRDTTVNQQYRLYVMSDSSWELYLAGNETNSVHDQRIEQGRLSELDVSANGTNTIQLIVQDESARFFLNGHFVKSLDVSAKNTAGDILVMAGFTADSQFPDKVTKYEDFTVWELP